MKKPLENCIELAFTYVIIFLLLREWLVPIVQLTDTGLSHLFLVFIGLALVLYLLKVRPLLSGLIKVGYIIWFIIFVYSENPFFSKHTIKFLGNEVTWNIVNIFSGNFGQVSYPFKTVLFFGLIWILIYLIQYWLTVYRNMFYFFALSVFFIATLDTFTAYDGKIAIVKVIVLGLIMTGMLFIKRLRLQIDEPSPSVEKWKIIMPMLISVALVSMVAFFLPKAGPSWADPVPFIKEITGQGDLGGDQKTIGYGNDDSRLGGPYKGDDTLIFTATSRDRHYWRIETKDMYTSKGWVLSADYMGETVFENDSPIYTSLQVGSQEMKSQIQVDMAVPMPFLIQTYGMLSVSTEEPTLYVQDGQTEKIVAKQPSNELVTMTNGSDKLLSSYTLSYSKPNYSLQQLQMSEPAMLETLDASYNRFLQLPDTLPQRVQQLAFDITHNKASVYEKIKAIERYFSQGNYRYDQTAVAIPTEQQDYVDQFLFDTKVGYCDNFSTSMVVMLRTIGIPARWVKGFAPGNAGALSDGVRQYQVTNNNAHSWVEAYVPGTGWIEFEPTIGFSGAVNINDDVQRDILQQEELLQPEEQLVPQQEKEPSTKQTTAPSTFRLDNVWEWLMSLKYIWFALMTLLIMLGVLLFVRRKTWIPKMLVRIYRKKEADWSNFDASYQALTKQLIRIGLSRQHGETLRAFAKRVDASLETEEMRKLTNVYEQYIYSENAQDVDFVELRESWEYLINRTIS